MSTQALFDGHKHPPDGIRTLALQAEQAAEALARAKAERVVAAKALATMRPNEGPPWNVHGPLNLIVDLTYPDVNTVAVASRPIPKELSSKNLRMADLVFSRFVDLDNDDEVLEYWDDYTQQSSSKKALRRFRKGDPIKLGLVFFGRPGTEVVDAQLFYRVQDVSIFAPEAHLANEVALSHFRRDGLPVDVMRHIRDMTPGAKPSGRESDLLPPLPPPQTDGGRRSRRRAIRRRGRSSSSSSSTQHRRRSRRI